MEPLLKSVINTSKNGAIFRFFSKFHNRSSNLKSVRIIGVYGYVVRVNEGG